MRFQVQLEAGRKTACCLILLLLVSCSSSGPGDPATLRLGVATTGSDPDPDGYTFAVDGGAAVPLATNDVVVVGGLNPGPHDLTVDGVAGNCSLDGGATHSITLFQSDTTDILL